MPRPLLLIAMLAFIVVTARAEPPPAVATAAAAGFKADLKQALLAGLEAGPVAALAACQIEAPAIAARRAGSALTLGRTSHRLRNPANIAPAWVVPLLQAYLDEPAGMAPRTVALANGVTGYVEPIMTQPLCLTCHGSKLAPDVSAALASRYPDDRATGFVVGDLRGVLWVEVRDD